MTAAPSYNLVGAIFVGRLDPESLVTMSVTCPLVLASVAIASATSAKVTPLISRSLGAGGAFMRAARTTSLTLTLYFLISGLIAIICLPFLDGILRSVGSADTILPPDRSCMSILIYAPFSMFN